MQSLKQYASYYSTAVVCLSFATLTLPANGYNFPIALLLLLIPFFIVNDKITLDKTDKYLIALLAIFFVFYLANIVLRPEATRLFDRNLRWLVFIGVFFGLLKFPPNKNAILASILVGSLASGIFAIIEKINTGTTRVGEHINPIQFGTFSMLLALLSIVIANHYIIRWLKTSRKNHTLLWLGLGSLACAFLGLYASILSGSRGGWLTAPLFAFIVYKQFSSELKIANWVYALLLVLFATLMLAAYKAPSLNIQNRVTEARVQFNDYFVSHTVTSSVGARLEMWRVALVLSSERPILGWGHDGYQKQVKVMADNKQTDPFLNQFNEPHNQFLDASAKHGIVGLLLILTLYFWPLKEFFHRYKSSIGAPESLFALLGGVGMLAFFDFSLTHSFINKTAGLMVFLFVLSLCWSMSRLKIT